MGLWGKTGSGSKLVFQMGRLGCACRWLFPRALQAVYGDCRRVIHDSIIGRGARFFMVAALLAWSGPRMEPVIIRYIEWLGWAVVGILVLIIFLTQV